MGFYRIQATRDNWITTFSPNNTNSVRASGSNLGKDTSLSVFARKSAFSSASLELARTLIQFDITELSGKIFQDKSIPSSSVSYILKMYDMKHDDTVSTSYDLFAFPVSRSWDEGSGKDADNFLDYGYSNWLSASSIQTWTTTGSDFLSTGYGSASQHFDDGQENLEVDITTIVNNWLTSSIGVAGGLPNNGLVLKLGNTEENNGINYYTKKFHSRESKYIDRLPYIEARWNDVLKDNRGNFSYNVENKLFMYNFVRGELVYVQEPITLRIQDHLIGASASYTQTFSTYQIASGVLTASVLISNTASFSATFYDIWFSGSRAYLTGNFDPKDLTASFVDQYDEFDVSVTNLKRQYASNEEARLKVNVRKRDYVTHRGVVSSASLDIDTEYIEKMYYSIINDDTGAIVVPYGTGSLSYTQLSYNNDGNYFNIFMNNFVPGFVYEVKFLIDINQYDKKELRGPFKFKVV